MSVNQWSLILKVWNHFLKPISYALNSRRQEQRKQLNPYSTVCFITFVLLQLEFNLCLILLFQRSPFRQLWPCWGTAIFISFSRAILMWLTFDEWVYLILLTFFESFVWVSFGFLDSRWTKCSMKMSTPNLCKSFKFWKDIKQLSPFETLTIEVPDCVVETFGTVP